MLGTFQSSFDPTILGRDATLASELREHRTCSIVLSGERCCGKTTLLERTLRLLDGYVRAAVVVANPRRAIAFQTTEPVSLLHEWISDADLDKHELLFVELGSTPPPVHLPVGDAASVMVISASDACADHALERHAHECRDADVIVLTKVDQTLFLPFDVHAFEVAVRRYNATAPIFETSATSGQGLTDWCRWVKRFCARHGRRSDREHSENYVG